MCIILFPCNSHFYFLPLVTPLIVIVLPIGQKSRQQRMAESANVKEKLQPEGVSSGTKIE